MARGMRPVAGRAVLTAAALAGAVACAGEGGRDLQSRAASTTAEPPGRAPTAPPTPASTTTTVGTPTTAAPLPEPGSPCELGSHRDCIDPDGDGQGVYLEYGAECMAAFADSPGLCSDLDHDGVAGYPDSG